MTQGKFPFLLLPAEIRNQIYELALTAPQHKPIKGGLRTSKPLGLVPSIICLSRQTWTECSALLYTENWFQAHPNLLNSLPYKTDPSRPVTSPACTPLIRKFYLEVRLDTDHWWNEEDLRKAFSGADDLHILAWQPSFGLCGLGTLERFRKVRRIGKAKVEGCGVPVEFARWLEETMESDESDDEHEAYELEQPQWDTWDNGNR
ncbi:MAG: hypothetical protein MMC23_005487 [Stictis urceolatum]|nr:hypothetical protein [Stictis urceolata]